MFLKSIHFQLVLNHIQIRCPIGQHQQHKSQREIQFWAIIYIVQSFFSIGINIHLWHWFDFQPCWSGGHDLEPSVEHNFSFIQIFLEIKTRSMEIISSGWHIHCFDTFLMIWCLSTCSKRIGTRFLCCKKNSLLINN